jgi:simple sugar transport system ATP-binding protein
MTVTVAGERRKPVLELRGLAKSYGQIQALRGVDLTIYPGEVHGLLGDNGAGKSTLLKIASGAVEPDEGDVLVDGREVRFSSPLDARERGIETVYQDLAIANTRSCTANVFIGREVVRRGLLGRLGVLHRPAMHAKARAEFAQLGLTIGTPTQKAGLLSGGQRQGVAIARAAMWAKHLVLLDEPTAALGVRQKATVDSLMRRMRERGLGLLLISHDVPEVLALADRITILRQGTVVTTRPAQDVDIPYVVEKMVGGVA